MKMNTKKYLESKQKNKNKPDENSNTKKDSETEELKEVLSKNILLKIENNKLSEENTLLLEKES